MLPKIDKKTLEVERTSTMDVWRAMEHCQKLGLCRAIGVSNCSTVMMLEILSFCEIRPCSNQIECHPFLTLDSVHEFCDKMGIQIEAYAPLNPQENPMVNAQFKNMVLLEDKVLLDLSKKYGKSPAQLVLNWHVHNHHVIFPRMTQEKHFAENMEIFDWEMSEDDYKKISGMNKNARYYNVVPTEDFCFVPISV